MRGLEHLHPEVREKALVLEAVAKSELGLDLIFTDTLRTQAEQTALYSQGRASVEEVNANRARAGLSAISASANKIITRAGPGSSWHEYGLAFDIAIVYPTGRKIIWNRDSDWNQDGEDDWAQVGALAEGVGLEWGGNFTSIYDAPHYQDRRGMPIAQMKQQFTPGEVAADLP